MKNREPHKLLASFPRSDAVVHGEDNSWPMSWIRAWDRFWFKPSDPVVVGLMRVFTGLIICYVHLMYTYDLMSYVGQDGWLNQHEPNSPTHFLRYEMPLFGQPADWQPVAPENLEKQLAVGYGHLFWSLYYHVHDPAWIYAIHFGIIGVMFLFTIGLWTRVTSVLAWMGAMCYLQRAPTLLFGMDTMMNLLLVYLMVAPSGAALSVDDWLRRRRDRENGLPDRPSPPLVSATLATRLLQINFCLVYLGSGFSKLLGSAWWNGTAIWGTVANSYFAPVDQAWYIGGLQFLVHHRWLWELAMASGCMFTLFVEIGLPFLVWHRNWRWIMVSGSILLHTGIGAFMGLVTFSLCMLCMVMCFIPPEAVREFYRRLAAAWQRTGQVERPIRVTVESQMSLSRR
jgi:hypothetical protein